jgi:hypothetical protein
MYSLIANRETLKRAAELEFWSTDEASERTANRSSNIGYEIACPSETLLLLVELSVLHTRQPSSGTICASAIIDAVEVWESGCLVFCTSY